MKYSTDERAWEQSKVVLGSLLAVCSAGLFQFVTLEMRSIAQTIALCCFVLSLPFVAAQFMDLFRENRQHYQMSAAARRIVTPVLLFGPFTGICAALMHVSWLLTAAYLLSSVIAVWAYGTGFTKEKESEPVDPLQQSAHIRYVADLHKER